jgi:hypothetical protein
MEEYERYSGARMPVTNHEVFLQNVLHFVLFFRMTRCVTLYVHKKTVNRQLQMMSIVPRPQSGLGTKPRVGSDMKPQFLFGGFLDGSA